MIKNNIEDITILVIGDMMLDRTVYGKINRVSQEAPVVIFDYDSEFLTLGGAGNVIRNLSSLGCKTIGIGVAGDDEGGKILDEQLAFCCDSYDLYIDPDRRTTVKSRYIVNNHQVFREDYESLSYFYDQPVLLDKYFTKDSKSLDISFIIISDYAKGFITKELMDYIRTLNIPFIIDPSPKNNPEFYNNAYIIKPNKLEYDQMCRIKSFDKINYEYIVVTEGENGSSLYNNKNELINNFTLSESKTVIDVCGAGDTYLAVLTLCLTMGLDINNSINIANSCSGVVVSKFGTEVITNKEFLDILKGI